MQLVAQNESVGFEGLCSCSVAFRVDHFVVGGSKHDARQNLKILGILESDRGEPRWHLREMSSARVVSTWARILL